MLPLQIRVSEPEKSGRTGEGAGHSRMRDRRRSADSIQGRASSRPGTSVGIRAAIWECRGLRIEEMARRIISNTGRLHLLVILVSSAMHSRKEVPGALLGHRSRLLLWFSSSCVLELSHSEELLHVDFENEAGDHHCSVCGMQLFPRHFSLQHKTR